MRMQAKKATDGFQTKIGPQAGGLTDRGPRINCLARSAYWEPSCWPIRLDDVTPLQWWRTMPANYLVEGPQFVLRDTLDKICLTGGHQWLSAIRGDAAASIAVIIESMPIAQITLEIDLAMTALVSCALDGNAAATLVLAHILHRTPLDHPFAQELSISWLALNFNRAWHMKMRHVAVHSKSISPGPENAEPIFHGGMQA